MELFVMARIGLLIGSTVLLLMAVLMSPESREIKHRGLAASIDEMHKAKPKKSNSQVPLDSHVKTLQDIINGANV